MPELVRVLKEEDVRWYNREPVNEETFDISRLEQFVPIDPDVHKQLHPWEFDLQPDDHPIIERVGDSWRAKEHMQRTDVIFYFSAGYDSADVESHPVLYKLWKGNTIENSHEHAHYYRFLLARRLINGERITDAELDHLPDPGKWSAAISKRWPHLNARFKRSKKTGEQKPLQGRLF